MYYFIQNSEDGIRVTGPLDHASATIRIEDLVSEEIDPEYRAKFVEEVPNEYTPEQHVLIIKGDIVTPVARETVVRYDLI